MEYVDQLEGDDKLRLIETLRDITEGKVRRGSLALLQGLRQARAVLALTPQLSPRFTSRCLERASHARCPR